MSLISLVMATIKSNSNCLYVWVPLGPLEKITHKEVTVFEFLFVHKVNNLGQRMPYVVHS